MCASVSVSTADSESSNTITGAERMSARAMATRCFCPPDSVTPRSPTAVSNPAGKASAVSSRQATRDAARTDASSSDASPIAMFSRIVRENRNGSCSTMAMLRRRYAVSMSRMSTPPMRMLPHPSPRG